MKTSHKFLIASAIGLAGSAYAGKSLYDAAHQPAYLQREAEIASLDKTLHVIKENKKNVSFNLSDCYKSNINSCEELLSQYNLLDKKYNLFKEERDTLVDDNIVAERSELLIFKLFGGASIGFGLSFLLLGLSQRKYEHQQ